MALLFHILKEDKQVGSEAPQNNKRGPTLKSDVWSEGWLPAAMLGIHLQEFVSVSRQFGVVLNRRALFRGQQFSHAVV